MLKKIGGRRMKAKVTKTKLKPCPFCGSASIEKKIAPLGTTMFICKCCGADVCFYGAEHEPNATQAWNRRFEKSLLKVR